MFNNLTCRGPSPANPTEEFCVWQNDKCDSLFITEPCRDYSRKECAYSVLCLWNGKSCVSNTCGNKVTCSGIAFPHMREPVACQSVKKGSKKVCQ